jgi:hypothetical protein
MAWCSRGASGQYYYRSVREGDRVRKEYVGQGENAEQLAREVEERRQKRLATREALQCELAQVAGADQCLQELRQLANLLVKAVLLAANCYQHHGQWRRRHGTDGQRDRGH